jgi:hypothetical protein
MPEYIDREALIADLEESVVISCKTENIPQIQRVLKRFINCIKNQPTAEVAEVRHGKWIATEKENIWGNMTKVLKCSVCKKWKIEHRGIVVASDYCPNCGAKMDKEDLQWKK